MLRYAWCFHVLIFLVLSGVVGAQHKHAPFTVVIDAGHGGHDPGALGLKTYEKNINLAIALKLGSLMKSSSKDVKVIFTRNDDRFVELFRRAGIANEAKADLFISIHCNANNNHLLKGAETYVMGLHKSQANLNIAKLENASILLESDYRSSYNGFDPNSDESYIIFSLNQNLNLDKSTDFAASIQAQMEERVGMNNRGVRQAGFLVLYKTTMPSVLVETGYLSNPDEEKFLSSGKGQDFIASAIYRAFKEIAGVDQVTERRTDTEKTPDFPHPENNETAVNDAHDTSPARPDVSGKKDDPVKENKPDQPAKDNSGRLSFRVQIATESRDIGTHAAKFSRFSNVTMYKHGGMFKYTVGDEADLPSGLRLLNTVREKGVKDAFIVIFRNDERLPQAEADRLMKK